MERWSESSSRAWFLVICLIVALAGLWFNMQPYACPVPKALLASDISLQPPCFEFWLNRYQALFGVLAAVAAAVLAWAGVQRQIDVAARQTSASMIKVVNDRLAASQRLNTALVVIDAFENFSSDALKECIDIVDILMSMDEIGDETFSLMIESDLVPAVNEYSNCVKKISDNADLGRTELEKAIVVGQTRIDVEEYLTTATMTALHHERKVRYLRSFCAIEQRPTLDRGREIGRFAELISRGGDRMNFQLLPAFKSTKLLVERLSVILESTVKKAEEGLL